MAEERRLSIRLGVDGADEVKRELDDIAKKGGAALGGIGGNAGGSSGGFRIMESAINGVSEAMASGIGQAAGYATAIFTLSKIQGRAAAAGTLLLETLAGVHLAFVAGAAVAGAFAAAFASMIGVVALGNKEFADWERRNLRSVAVLQATGNAVGRTKKELNDLATAVEKSSLFDGADAQDAIATLLTFRTVARSTFDEAIVLSADLAEVFGGSLAQNATRLGKALEDPIQGISALRRVGVSFTASEKEKVKALVDSGNAAEAQRLILEKLELQVGGAAAAAGKGTTGAFKSLTDQIKAFNEALGEAINLSGAFRAAAKAVEAARIDLFPTTEEKLGGIGGGSAVLGSAPGLGGLVQLKRLIDLTVRRPALERQLAEEQQLEFVAQARAQALAAKATRNINSEEIFGLGSSAESELFALNATDREKAIQEFEASVQKIQNLKKIVIEGENGLPDRVEFVNEAEVEKAIEGLTRLKDARLADISAQERQADLAKIAALQDQLNIAGIERRFASDPRQSFIESQVAGLTEKATSQDEQHVRALSAALFDETEALRAANEERERRARNLESDTALIERLNQELRLSNLSGDPVEQAVIRSASQLSETATREQVAKVRELATAIAEKKIEEQEAAEAARTHAAAVGEIENAILATLPAYERAIAEIIKWRQEQLDALDETKEGYDELAEKVEQVFNKRISEAEKNRSGESKTFKQGIVDGLQEVADKSKDVGTTVHESVVTAFDSLEDSIVASLKGGEGALESFRNLLLQVQDDLLRMLVRQTLIAPLANGLLGALGGSASGAALSVPSNAVFGSVPGFASGGPVIDSPLRAPDGGVFIKAHRKEGVLNQRAMENLGRLNRGEMFGSGGYQGPSEVVLMLDGDILARHSLRTMESREGKRVIASTETRN